VLAALVSSEGERYTMNAAQEGSQALAEVAWLFDKNVAVLRASGFPALEAGKVYQLWLIRNGERTSGGTFVVDEQGTGTFVFTPPESLDNFEGMGITPEPAGGSPGPTAPPVVRAQL
jgi:anti-sigma-K factor RskA